LGEAGRRLCFEGLFVESFKEAEAKRKAGKGYRDRDRHPSKKEGALTARVTRTSESC